jgi:hypothetical protein
MSLGIQGEGARRIAVHRSLTRCSGPEHPVPLRGRLSWNLSARVEPDLWSRHRSTRTESGTDAERR